MSDNILDNFQMLKILRSFMRDYMSLKAFSGGAGIAADHFTATLMGLYTFAKAGYKAKVLRNIAKMALQPLTNPELLGKD